MSTEEEKAKNRTKQARFQERHPGYYRKRSAHKQIKSTLGACRQGSFRIFELADPRDLDNLPRLVGYCRQVVTPVWANFWLAKDYSKAPWAAWLRELATLGLQPVELKAGMLGIAVGLSEKLAQSLVRLRLRRMNEVITGNPILAPPWSLRNMMACKDSTYPVPVGCCCGQKAVHFSNTLLARRETAEDGQFLPRLIDRVDFDKQGRLWFDD